MDESTDNYARNKNDWDYLTREFAKLGVVIESQISNGTNSQLFKVRQTNLQRDAVVKVLANGLLPTDVAYLRFQEESKILGSLTHPNIVQLYGVGRLPDGRSYMIMEYLEGKTLEQIIASGESLDESAIRGYAANLCEALIAAHQHKIIHRDVKPSNVIISDTEGGGKIARLIDFGIFKRTDGNEGGVQLTQLGSLPGTPNYMSPEQCSKQEVDERSDIYSLGCLLYELISGKPPMDAETDMVIMSNHVNKKVTHVPSNRPISNELKKIVLRCLEKDKNMRFPNASSVLELLKAPYDSKNGNNRTKYLAIAGLCLLVVLASGLFIFPMITERRIERYVPRGADYLYVDNGLALRTHGWLEFKDKLDKLPLSETEKVAAIRRWGLEHIKNPDASFIDLQKSEVVIQILPLESLKPLLDRVNARLEEVERGSIKSNVRLKDPTRDLKTHELFCLLDLKYYAGLRARLFDESESAAERFYSTKSLHGFVKKELYLAYANDLLKYLVESRVASDAVFRRLKESFHDPEKAIKLGLTYSDLLSPHERFPVTMAAYNELMLQHELSDRSILALMIVRLRELGYVSETAEMVKKFPLLPTDGNDVALLYFYTFLEVNDLNSAVAVVDQIKGNEIPDSNALRNTVLACELQLATARKQRDKAVEIGREIFKKYGKKVLELTALKLALAQAIPSNGELLQLYDGYFRDQPQYLAILHASRGHSLRFEHKEKEAIKEYELSHHYFDIDNQAYPGRLNVYIGECESYLHLNDFENAKLMLQKAINCGYKDALPDKFYLASTQGIIFRAEGNYVDAARTHAAVLKSFTDEDKKIFSTCYCDLIGELCVDYYLNKDKIALAAVIRDQTPFLTQAGPHGIKTIDHINDILKQLN